MKAYFDDTHLIVEPENYTEKLALDYWLINHNMVSMPPQSKWALMITIDIEKLEKKLNEQKAEA